MGTTLPVGIAESALRTNWEGRTVSLAALLVVRCGSDHLSSLASRLLRCPM
jgi:hypothetical protein